MFALLVLAVFMVFAFAPESGSAKKSRKGKRSATATKKLPVITRIDPKNVAIGETLTLSGRNIVKGNNTMRVIFQRSGSTRRFTSRGRGINTKSLTVVVPNVAADLNKATDSAARVPTLFRIRVISKYGMSKSWTNPTISPLIFLGGSGDNGENGDCDQDSILNATDLDDDNDLLTDVEEQAIGTDACVYDSDGDSVSDYYEYRVAYEFNGGPVLPYPGRAPYPNPLIGDSIVDFDGDKLNMGQEFAAWQYTGRMDRFYSDADQDSDNDGIWDDEEDEDSDLLPNYEEITVFINARPLDFLMTDTDGDGLCDGLDDQDHDGPPTSNAVADCSTPVPNNGPADTPAGTGAGDPNPSRIDGDDNIYSNWYEWAYGIAGSPYDACSPSLTSPYCPHP